MALRIMTFVCIPLAIVILVYNLTAYPTLVTTSTPLSASSQALQTVLTKSVLLRAQLRRTELFAGAAVLTLLLLAPPWLLIDGLELARAEGATLTSRTMGLMLANGACSFCSQ